MNRLVAAAVMWVAVIALTFVTYLASASAVVIMVGVMVAYLGATQAYRSGGIGSMRQWRGAIVTCMLLAAIMATGTVQAKHESGDKDYCGKWGKVKHPMHCDTVSKGDAIRWGGTALVIGGACTIGAVFTAGGSCAIAVGTAIAASQAIDAGVKVVTGRPEDITLYQFGKSVASGDAERIIDTGAGLVSPSSMDAGDKYERTGNFGVLDGVWIATDMIPGGMGKAVQGTTAATPIITKGTIRGSDALADGARAALSMTGSGPTATKVVLEGTDDLSKSLTKTLTEAGRGTVKSQSSLASDLAKATAKADDVSRLTKASGQVAPPMASLNLADNALKPAGRARDTLRTTFGKAAKVEKGMNPAPKTLWQELGHTRSAGKAAAKNATRMQRARAFATRPFQYGQAVQRTMLRGLRPGLGRNALLWSRVPFSIKLGSEVTQWASDAFRVGDIEVPACDPDTQDCSEGAALICDGIVETDMSEEQRSKMCASEDGRDYLDCVYLNGVENCAVPDAVCEIIGCKPSVTPPAATAIFEACIAVGLPEEMCITFKTQEDVVKAFFNYAYDNIRPDIQFDGSAKRFDSNGSTNEFGVQVAVDSGAFGLSCEGEAAKFAKLVGYCYNQYFLHGIRYQVLVDGEETGGVTLTREDLVTMGAMKDDSQKASLEVFGTADRDGAKHKMVVTVTALYGLVSTNDDGVYVHNDFEGGQTVPFEHEESKEYAVQSCNESCSAPPPPPCADGGACAPTDPDPKCGDFEKPPTWMNCGNTVAGALGGFGKYGWVILLGLVGALGFVAVYRNGMLHEWTKGGLGKPGKGAPQVYRKPGFFASLKAKVTGRDPPKELKPAFKNTGVPVVVPAKPDGSGPDLSALKKDLEDL